LNLLRILRFHQVRANEDQEFNSEGYNGFKGRGCLGGKFVLE